MIRGQDGHDDQVECVVVPESPTEVDDLWLPGRDQIQKSCLVKIPLTYLPALSLGAVWENGAIRRSDVLTVGHAPMMRMARSSVQLTEPRSDSVESFSLPRDVFPLSHKYKNVVGTKILKLVSSENVILLFPTIELIRFYLGIASTPLLRAFFAVVGSDFSDPDFLDRFVDLSQTFMDRQGGFHTSLRDGLVHTDAYILGRLWASPLFREFAANVSQGMRSGNIRQPITPKVLFPFVEPTSLTVEGLHYYEGDMPVILVYRIRACTHPMPYDRVTIAVHAVQRQHFPPQSLDGKMDDKTSSSGGAVSTVSSSPSERKAILFESEAITTLFPDLLKKPLQKLDTKREIPRPITIYTRDRSVEMLGGFGAGFGRDSLRRISLRPKEDTKPHTVSSNSTTSLPVCSRFEQLDKLRVILQKDGFVTRTRCSSNAGGWIDLMDGVDWETAPSIWCSMRDHGAETYRSRRAQIIEIERASADKKILYSYILELETEKSCLLYFEGSSKGHLDDATIRKVIDACITCEGQWRKIENQKLVLRAEIDGLRLQAVSHHWQDDETAFSDAVKKLCLMVRI